MNQFHLFNKLPKEIRYRIWEATCQDNGTLHIFGDRWLMHYLVPGMPPAPIQMPTPVALFVCYESRKVAHRWIKENKATKQFRNNEALGMTLIREFDRDRDMLYVPRDSWYDFIEHMERDYEAGDDRPLCSDVGYLAVPAFTAYYSIPNLACIMAWARNLRAIYVVWDDLPRDPDSMRDDVVAGVDDVHPRVEIVSSPSPGETVRMKHVDTDTEREFVEEAELEEWMDEMNDVWATAEVDEDMVDDEGCVKMPRINVRVAEVPRQQRPW
ncbi:hypothetical protein LCI18_011501 [Fusarium solani-melongenae]|uniref:Uncharacterized protein n=1 Tax=Fusarium solani subsp. cucurbitae TaxID=2747967 RepID=A0ACD3ZI91_FUSSC|nr:hypothetical protein LCI18_011501 [Fusarium solani-melongenae]